MYGDIQLYNSTNHQNPAKELVIFEIIIYQSGTKPNLVAKILATKFGVCLLYI